MACRLRDLGSGCSAVADFPRLLLPCGQTVLPWATVLSTIRLFIINYIIPLDSFNSLWCVCVLLLSDFTDEKGGFRFFKP